MDLQTHQAVQNILSEVSESKAFRNSFRDILIKSMWSRNFGKKKSTSSVFLQVELVKPVVAKKQILSQKKREQDLSSGEQKQQQGGKKKKKVSDKQRDRNNKRLTDFNEKKSLLSSNNSNFSAAVKRSPSPSTGTGNPKTTEVKKPSSSDRVVQKPSSEATSSPLDSRVTRSQKKMEVEPPEEELLLCVVCKDPYPDEDDNFDTAEMAICQTMQKGTQL